MPQALSAKLTRQANDLMHRYGLGHWQLMATQGYINFLTQKGIIGKGKEIDPDLPPQGTFAYYEALFRKISLREGNIRRALPLKRPQEWRKSSDGTKRM